MGRAKEEMLRRETVSAIAIDVAVQAGAIERCPRHPEITVDQGDTDANKRAYAIGTNMVKGCEINANRSEFMDAIKAAIDESIWGSCPRCADEQDD